MARRSPTSDPEPRAHQDCLGYLQPVGLVVAASGAQHWRATALERFERLLPDIGKEAGCCSLASSCGWCFGSMPKTKP